MGGTIESVEKVFHPNASPFDPASWSEHFGSDFCFLWKIHVNDYVKVRDTSFNRIASRAFHDTLDENKWKIVLRTDHEIESCAFPTFSLISLASGSNGRCDSKFFVCANFLDKNGAIYSPTGRNGVTLVEISEKHAKSNQEITVSDFKFPFRMEDHGESIGYYDSLRILVRMWTVCGDKEFNASGAPSLSDNFEWLLNDQTFADVTLQLGTAKILAHRAVLAARSTVFRDELLAASPQGMLTLDMSDYSPNVVCELLTELYQGQFTPEIPIVDALDTIKIAHVYNLEPLKFAHGSSLRGRLDANIASETLVCSLLYKCEVLKVDVIKFLKRAKVSLVGNPIIEQLAKTHLKEVVEILAGRTPKSSISKSPPSTLKEDFKWLLCDATFSDVTISVGNSNFSAHKAVLSARSNVFWAMFQAPMNEAASNIVKIHDFSPRVVRGLLEFIYTDSATIDEGNAASYLKLGDMYNVQGIMQLAENVMANNINMQNAFAAFECTTLFNTTVLKQKLNEFFKRNRAALASDDALEQLQKTHSKEVLEMFQ